MRKKRLLTKNDDEPGTLKLIDEFDGEWKLPVSRRAILLGVFGTSSTTALVWGFIENKRMQDRIDDETDHSVNPGPATVRGPGSLAGPQATPVWTAKLPRNAQQLTVAAGTVIAEAEDGGLHGFDAQSGAAKWKSAVKFHPDHSPLPTLGDTFFGLTTDKHLQAIGALDGAPRWQVPFADPTVDGLQTSQTVGSTVLVTGLIYAKDGTTAAAIWAVDTTTQSVAWKNSQVSNHTPAQTLAVSQSAGVILSAATAQPGLIAYTLNDRTELWRKSPENDGPAKDYPANCVAVSGNTFYWAAPQLHALDATSGKELWSASASQADNEFRAVVVVPHSAPDGGDLVVAMVVGPTYGGALYAFAASTGDRVWRQEASRNFGVDTVLSAAGGIVFAAESDNGSVFAVDARTGTTRWTFHDPAVSNALTWVTAVDGTRLYVAYGKTLLAFEP